MGAVNASPKKIGRCGIFVDFFFCHDLRQLHDGNHLDRPSDHSDVKFADVNRADSSA